MRYISQRQAHDDRAKLRESRERVKILTAALSGLLVYFAGYESDYGETIPEMEAARKALEGKQ